MKYDKNKTVIVYLAMNTKKDESYGRDSRSMLEKSLDSLYVNYNNEFKHDIIVFYDSKYPFTESDIAEITKGRKEIRFQLIPDELWCPPQCQELKNNPNPKTWIDPKFSIGYRNMMRWYGVLIYKYLTDLGYEWYMRMDDDSLLHSRIEYDLFEFMHNNQYEYGFRSYCNDHIMVSSGLIEFCRDYCDSNNIKPSFLDRFGHYNEYKNTRKHNILGYYNNFLISKLSFWMRDDVQQFLKHYDNSGFQYTRRWNDLISQAVTVQIFMDRNKVYHFNDWCYEHATFGGKYDNKTSLDWGGIYPAVKDRSVLSSSYTRTWLSNYGAYCKNTFDTLDVQNCLDKNHIDLLPRRFIPKKNNFRPFNNDHCYFIGEYSDLSDVYLAINDYWINCYSTIRRSIQFQYSSPIAFIWFHSENNNWYHKKLYVINSEKLIKNKNSENQNMDVISFMVSNDIFVTKSQKTSGYTSNLTANDQFVHYIFGNNYNGYYVEAGACDGIKNSNTYFLEYELGWTGTLVEPTRQFDLLTKNRPSSKNINCILGNSNNKNVEFIEFTDINFSELSCTKESLDRLPMEDSTGRKDIQHLYDGAIKNKVTKTLEQKTLDSLLDDVDAPYTIDYLSLDTEGTEASIIESINFNKREILLISAENLHYNNILINNGYIRIKNPFDQSNNISIVTWVDKDKIRPWDYWWISSKLFLEKKDLLKDLI